MKLYSVHIISDKAKEWDDISLLQLRNMHVLLNGMATFKTVIIKAIIVFL